MGTKLLTHRKSSCTKQMSLYMAVSDYCATSKQVNVRWITGCTKLLGETRGPEIPPEIEISRIQICSSENVGIFFESISRKKPSQPHLGLFSTLFPTGWENSNFRDSCPGFALLGVLSSG